jgi:hypothetical protein
VRPDLEVRRGAAAVSTALQLAAIAPDDAIGLGLAVVLLV